jgi:Flp pilus assembly protein TadG
MHRPLTSSVRSFAADERGNVAVLFAFMSAILLAAGIAIDYARTIDAALAKFAQLRLAQ